MVRCEGEVRHDRVAEWVTKTMRLAYEARVAVRGELASPKSFSRLIHNNKDDRDKRNTPEDTRPCWDKEIECHNTTD